MFTCKNKTKKASDSSSYPGYSHPAGPPPTSTTASLGSATALAPTSSCDIPVMESTSEAWNMKVEGTEEEGPLRGLAVADRLYLGEGGAAKKQRTRERLGCTTAKERISRMPPCVAGKRSSIYRGVTRHRWTGRYEAHLWDKSTWNENQNKKGKQVYLGAYDDEEAAARAYDLAALKYWGAGTLINFPVSDYSRDLEEMQMVTKEEYLVSLRRKSSAFSRGFPKCRGISRHLQGSRLETSLGHVLGSDYGNSFTSDQLVENKCGNNLCMDGKIDLTNHIRWWGLKRGNQPDSILKSFYERHNDAEDINKELRAFECQKQNTVPYQLPSLGVPHDKKGHVSSVSSCTILSKCAAYKNFLHKLSESHLRDCSNGETRYEKAAPLLSIAGGIERTGIPLSTNEITSQRTQHPRAPILTVPPSRVNWNSVDPVPDTLFWTSLVPPAELSMTTMLKKTETSLPYPYNCQD